MIVKRAAFTSTNAAAECTLLTNENSRLLDEGLRQLVGRALPRFDRRADRGASGGGEWM